MVQIPFSEIHFYFYWFFNLAKLSYGKKYHLGVREALQKFCIAQPFSTCGNTVALKLRAYVTEGYNENEKNNFKSFASPSHSPHVVIL